MAPFPDEDVIFDKLIDPVIPSDAAHSLNDEFSCHVLEALYPHLDLISRKSHSHIDPLHVQLRKRRAVQITEEARLHLVWEHDTMYIKPLPVCLLDPGFWDTHLRPGSVDRPHALGFMRTYAYLIRHRSDLSIAKTEDLIPPSHDLVHSKFEAFIRHFRDIGDDEVSPRWEFGQLRLSWLNWAVRIFQPATATAPRSGMLDRLFYVEQHSRTGQFIGDFGAPLLFTFATLSLILSAMQVVLAAQVDKPWQAFMSVSAWFSVVVIVMLVVVLLTLLLVVVGVLAVQLGFAIRSRRRRTKADSD